MSEKGYSKSRRSSPGSRHRVNNGPATLNVDPVPAPSPAEIGPGHQYWEAIKAGGPRALIGAQHEAARLSEKFGEEIETRWCLATPWLAQLVHDNRERARYTLTWRPRFLAVLALTRSIIFGCKAARVTKDTVRLHREQDPDFDAQVMAAQDHAVEMLHDVTMSRALEGVVEPVFWQGIPVGHIRKHDNRLAIEMLRAHLPKTFKTPGYGGATVSVSAAAGAGGLAQTNIIVDEATRDELVALRQESLRQIAAGRGIPPMLEADATVLPPRDASH